jgi:hypothetical protein
MNKLHVVLSPVVIVVLRMLSHILLENVSGICAHVQIYKFIPSNVY